MPRRPNDESTANLHLRIPKSDYIRLHREAKTRMVSVNVICTKAIEQYLTQLAKQEPLP